jgi:hypothetical protein
MFINTHSMLEFSNSPLRLIIMLELFFNHEVSLKI